ncbi:hypothetical protein GP486_004201 [Trichoglossum hirsutum]|uniref:DUF7580 domain-containing protein n=1 Tax=Trichoglossum hirsutum TaxID=265104 RepID=A0A9P8LBM8_9PEZI|nr:hypothetical protein GP486_004201 [Trichoglossum hirsutum]
MSGFEVAGVVLGVLPLVVSAIENYERILGPVITYRKYSKELKTFSTELGVQKDIFQNECVWLLSELVDAKELEDMLEESSHTLRTSLREDLRLNREFSQRLGQSYQQILCVLQLIGTTLDEIYEETRDLGAGLSRPERAKAELVDLKAWRHHLRQKVKLSFGKPSLDRMVNDLRYRNQAFLAISQQVVRFNGYTQSSSQMKEPVQLDRSIEKLEKVRTASQGLCQVLATLWSCPEHAEHSANLQLCPKTLGSPTESPSRVSFDVALTYWAIERPTPSSESPILLVIESTVEGDPNTIKSIGGSAKGEMGSSSDARLLEVIDSLRTLGQKSFDYSEEVSNPKKAQQHKGVRFAGAGVAGNGKDSPKDTLSKLEQNQPLDALTDLCSVPSLCVRIQQLSKLACTDKPICVGYLAEHGAGKHLVYWPRHAQPSLSGAVSLAKVISKRQRMRSLPKPDKWRLAGVLAKAVLQYHSTPWLRTNWKADDILFFGISDPERPGSLKSPHLHLLERSKGKQKSHAITEDVWVKNETLFRLGVILLELEFEASLEAIIQELRVDGIPQAPDAPLAHQLLIPKRHAGERMGTLYGRIVRMCLDCDFGLGLDNYSLSDPRLQRLFYSQIVCQFEDGMPDYSKIWPES